MLLLTAILFTQTAAPPPVGLKGADVLLKQIAGATSQQNNPKPDDVKSEIWAFSNQSETMSPANAATGWLKLLADIGKPLQGNREGSGPKSADAVAVLPPPTAWPLIAASVAVKPVAKRTAREQELVLLFDELNGNRDAEHADIEALMTKLPVDTQSTNASWYAAELNVDLAARSQDGAWLADALVRNANVTGQAWTGVQADDFVAAVGVERAKPVLEQILMAPRFGFGESNRISPSKTNSLMVDLAIQDLDKLKKAPWGLACHLDGARLYPILAKRWPMPSSDPTESFGGDSRSNAKLTYALSLELAGKHDLAVAQSEDWDWPNQPRDLSNWNAYRLDRPEYKRAFYNLEVAVAAKHPGIIQWNQLETIAADLGQTAALEPVVRAAVQSGHADSSAQTELGKLQLSFLLAEDKVNEAATILRKQGAIALEPNTNDGSSSEASLHLAVLGLLTGQKEWVGQGISAAEKLAELHSSFGTAHYQGRDQSTTELLVSIGRAPEAERILANGLRAERAAQYGSAYNEDRYLTGLVELYYQTN